MPIPFIPLAIGAAVGGGGVWVATDVTKQLTTFAVIGGAFYWYLKKG